MWNNIIFSFVYEHFKDEFKSLDEEGSLMDFEGNSITTKTIEATFTFEGNNYTSKYSVLDISSVIENIQTESGIQIHGVLGIPFLTENRWIIDFQKLQVYNSNGN